MDVCDGRCAGMEGQEAAIVGTTQAAETYPESCLAVGSFALAMSMVHAVTISSQWLYFCSE